ncbi:MAG TPA: SdrD B-like domain-containing protein, partial [Pyrinomonadaceae bacterium]|nr:SdrD B-like domain-containing protein [Pyrinomonadaceae bacterium]
MTKARPVSLRRALAAVLLAALFAAAGRGALAFDGTTGAGSTISNRAEASYTDPEGNGFATVSTTITLTVLTVAAITVTPDETEPSATVSPNERLARVFRVCNTGNTPDFYTITAAEVSAPAALVSLHFDDDATGTLTAPDREIVVGTTMSPRLNVGQCVGVIAEVDSNAGRTGDRLTIRINARSAVTDAVNAGVEDAGTIVNVYGDGARFSSPADPTLPPVKLVEGHERTTAAPGQPLEYTIAFRNSGDIVARSVVLRDDLPTGLVYVPGSLRLNGRALTDQDDADEGSVGGRIVEVRLAQVAIGEAVEVAFRARVTGVANGAGVVNTAVTSASNAPAVSSTSATAVVNPFGLVYKGRSAGTPVPGARVSLLLDSTTGAAVPLTGSGSDPNTENANPFGADGAGRFSFVLSDAQLGTAQQPARYFLNVTAQGFRSRLIETTITPATDAPGLFALTVRSLDGQPVARDGSFELTEDAVEIQRLAAYALNVPMFENTALEITKSADRPSVEIGDTVTYRVEVHNSTVSALNDAVVRDQLPPSFQYAEGTALVEVPPAARRSVTPDINTGGLIVFRLGRIEAGERATLTYRVRVGANAREGQQFNTASATGTLTGGERVSTPQARASVRVRRGVFSSQQVIVGRVYADANSNGKFDEDERGVPGVRLYLNNGQSVITDSEGLYNFPAVNEGSQVLSLDPVTLPAGYALADSGRSDERSWTRLLRTPLGGGALLRQNFALRSPDSEHVGSHPSPNAAGDAYAPGPKTKATGASLNGSLFGGSSNNFGNNSGNNSDSPNDSKESNGKDAPKPSASNAPAAAGTYEMKTEETLEPVAPGDVRVLTPQPDETVLGAALEISARTNAAWTVAVEVAGQRVPDSKIGEKRVDRKNDLATFTFVGLNVAPGPNRIRVTAVGPDGSQGKSVEVTAYGRGPAKRLEILSDKAELSAGGRDSTVLRVRAFDQWNHPAADGSVALAVSTGRLIRVEEDDDKNRKASEEAGVDVPDNPEAKNVPTGEQIIPLVGGEGRVILVSDNAPGAAE